MTPLKLLLSGLSALLLVLSLSVNADVDAEDFVDEASAKGLAEIETGKMALRKGTSQQVKDFAQKMIDDHTAANRELAAIAKGKDLDVADDAELMNQAKAFILKQRDGESFDKAYANNQVVAHEQTIELFREARTDLRDPELKAFVEKTLPKLEKHLRMAQDLARATSASEAEIDNRTNMDTDRHEMERDNRNMDNDVDTTPRPGTTTSPQ